MEDLEGLGLEHLSLDQLEKARSAISHNTAGGRGEASGAGTPAHISSTVGSRGRSQAPGLPPHLARGRGSGTTNNEASGLNTPAHPSSMADSRERSQAPALPPHLARARGSAMDSETDSASLKMSGSRASSPCLHQLRSLPITSRRTSGAESRRPLPRQRLQSLVDGLQALFPLPRR